ncbi:hypothetical protein [Streptomyces halstedii]|uniref:hypothetical protein n=1 Tax=Streptomyces halstedii TaxID=1944 RepID=UPI00345F1B1B
MTDTPMTPDREQKIRRARTHCEAGRFETEDERSLHVWGPSQYPTQEMCQRCTVMRWWAEEPDTDQAVLLAEVDRLRARVAELEAQHAAVIALHRKHDDSEHCFADDEQWPCNTRTALGQAVTNDEDTEAHPAPCRVPDSPDCTCPAKAWGTPAPRAVKRARPRNPRTCSRCDDTPAQWCPDCEACRLGCFATRAANPCTHPNAPWNTEATR